MKTEEKLIPEQPAPAPLLNNENLALFAARVNNLLMKAFVSGDDAGESAKLQEICHQIYLAHQESSNAKKE